MHTKQSSTSAAEINRASEKNKRFITTRLHFKTRERILLVNPTDVVYFSADGNYSNIHFTDGQTECVTLQIGKIEKMIINANLVYLLRVNRSFIINFDYLVEINHKSNTCTMCLNDLRIEVKLSSRGIKKVMNIIG